MTEQEKLAREWAGRYLTWNTREDSPELYAAAELVLAHTAPLTMAEIGWKTSEHYLAGAVDLDGSEVVMLGLEGGNIRVCDVDDMHLDYMQVLECPSNLTPNGKRYELREITVSQDEKVGADQPEHPKVLRTEEDLREAPGGTVVTRLSHVARTKLGGEWHGLDKTSSSEIMAEYGTWEVLRWGWGK